MSDKMREEFESWFYASKYAQVATPTESAKQAAWDGWKASRESLVIELPDPEEPNEYASGDCAACGWNNMRDEAIAAIEAAGLKVNL